jgi:hypothetical protein
VTKRFVLLLAATTAFEGIRAGASLFRGILDLPARAQIGATAFAEFSRATDLSSRGLVFYAIFGFGGALLTGLTWLAAIRTGAPLAVRRATAVATICSLTILLLTIHAAPIMHRVGAAPNESALLEPLLEEFVHWTIPRLAAAVISFCAMVFALTIGALRWTERES